MKIAFLLSHPPDPRMYRRMVALRDEHTVELVYWDRCLKVQAAYSIPEGVESHCIAVPAPLGQWLRRILPLGIFCIRVLRLLREIRPDVLHCGNLDMLLVGWIYRVVFDRRAKLVYEIADLPGITYSQDAQFMRRLMKRWFLALERFLCTDISLLVVTSPFFWDEYYSTFVPHNKVLFVPNAPEQRLFGAYSKKAHQYFTVGFIGSVRYPRQLKMLIDATDGMQGIRVLIAGEGKAYTEIEEYCRGRSHVTFHGPYNYERDIVDLYSRIDCVYAVYDTQIDNVRVALPNRLYEAIVCELPIIVADGTALGRFVTEHKIGFAIPADDINALRDVLTKMVMEPTISSEIGDRLRSMKCRFYAESGYARLRQRYQHL